MLDRITGLDLTRFDVSPSLFYCGVSCAVRTKWVELEAAEEIPFGCGVVQEGKKFRAPRSASDKVRGVLCRSSFDLFTHFKSTVGKMYRIAYSGPIVVYSTGHAIKGIAANVIYKPDELSIPGAFTTSIQNSVAMPAFYNSDGQPFTTAIVTLTGAR